MTDVMPKPKTRMKRFAVYMSRYWMLYALLFLPIIYFLIFKYWTMVNVLVAFKTYSIRLASNVFSMKWAGDNGFEYFIKAFANNDFLEAIRNTFLLNGLDLLIGFPAPILLAILLNELAFKRFKRVTQTVAYMPHFLSWVIIAQIAQKLLAPNDGFVNILLSNMGLDTIPFLNDPTHWVFTYVFTGLWQSIGWSTILYLAAITSISPELYEAASVDGASRWRKIWHITLPGLRPTIIMLLIFAIGGIVGGNFDRNFAMRNPLVYDVSDNLPVFVYQYGIQGTQVSLAAAVGLFQSVAGLIFVLGTNWLAERMGERGVI